jgi:glycerophosphoryl diester phosphodiesterase
METRVTANIARLVCAVVICHACSNVMAVDLQGHRGARGLAPENTLAGFARALGIGVTTLELDIAITKDDVPVVSHDPRLNPDITRGPDGRFLESTGPIINQLTLEELQKYDVGRLKPGSDYARRYPQQRAEDGARIPRLSDVFALVRKSGNENVRFAIETKVTPLNPQETPDPESFAKAVISAIREAGMERRSTILSFDWRTLAIVQRDAPEIGTVYLTAQQRWLDNIGADQPAGSAWTNGIQFREHGSVPKMIKAAGGRIWSAYYGDLDGSRVREAKELGIAVLAWTVNAPADIVRTLDLGVDGIVTDRPDLVREEMKRRGMPLPAATALKH